MSLDREKVDVVLNILFAQMKREGDLRPGLQLHEIEGQTLFPVRGTDGGIKDEHAFMLTAPLHFYFTTTVDLSRLAVVNPDEFVLGLRRQLEHSATEFLRYLEAIEKYASALKEPSGASVSDSVVSGTEPAAHQTEGSLPPK